MHRDLENLNAKKLREFLELLLKSVSRLSEFGSIRIGLGLVRPFDGSTGSPSRAKSRDRFRAVSEIEPASSLQVGYVSVSEVGFASSAL
jgi:hypothetical protein